MLGQGKTPQQVQAIVSSLAGRGNPVLVTRTDQTAYGLVVAATPSAVFKEEARAIVVPGDNSSARLARRGFGYRRHPPICRWRKRRRLTATLMGSLPERINDVGVAGVAPAAGLAGPVAAGAAVIVVVAGMEAALASVTAGLVSAPVIAVPTSVGYGASYEGIAALLGMLNSCAPRGGHRKY